MRARPGYFAPRPPPVRPSIEFTLKDLTRELVDVTIDDLEVVEDGVAQKVEAFQEAVTPVSIVFALDASGSMKKATEDVKAAAKTFVQNVRPEDALALILFANKSEFAHDLTTRRDWSVEAIDKYVASGGTALYDAAFDALTRLRGIEGRRVVVLMTDGRDENNPGTAPGSVHTYPQVLERLKTVDATIYAVGLGAKIDRDEARGAGDDFRRRVLLPAGRRVALAATSTASSRRCAAATSSATPAPTARATARCARSRSGARRKASPSSAAAATTPPTSRCLPRSTAWPWVIRIESGVPRCPRSVSISPSSASCCGCRWPARAARSSTRRTIPTSTWPSPGRWPTTVSGGSGRGQFASASSSPLWTVLLAVLWKLGAHAVWVPFALNVLFGVAFLGVCGSYVARTFRLRTTAAAAPLRARRRHARCRRWPSSAWSTRSRCCWLSSSRGRQPNVWRESGATGCGRRVVAALMVATRYESLFLVAVVGAILLWQGRIRPVVCLGVAAAVPVAAFALYSVAHGGLVLPNSVLMKSGPGRFSTVGAGLSAVATDWLAIGNLFLRPSLLVLTLGVLDRRCCSRRRRG